MSQERPHHQDRLAGFFTATDLAGINRWTYMIIAALMISAFAWMMLAQLASAVIISGTVKVYKNRLVLQHPDGGQIESVHIKEGDQVQAQQPILSISNPQLVSMVRGLERQIFSETIRALRLQAETTYPAGNFVPPQGTFDTEQTAIIQTEKDLATARIRNLQSQEQSVRQQIAHVQAEIAALKRSLENDQAVLNRTKELATQGFVSSVSAINAEQTINQRQADMSRAQQRVAELQQRLPVLIDDFRNNAALELRAANERILDAEEKLRPSVDALKNLEVKAPAEGTVVSLLRLGPGAVLGAKETIAELVPTNRGLILEGSLSTDQVVFIQPGMQAKVRIAQLSKMGFDEFNGTLSTISADSISQGMLGTSAYMVQVDIGALSPEAEALLRPGMPVEIFIQTGTRTPFEYLTDPITSFIQRAARE
jgi:HlyD family type I secretion membrane fusion protein